MAEFSKKCLTCRFAQVLTISPDCFCQFSGLVKPTHICKRYKTDLMKLTAKRRRNIDTSRFVKEDFSID